MGALVGGAVPGLVGCPLAGGQSPVTWWLIAGGGGRGRGVVVVVVVGGQEVLGLVSAYQFSSVQFSHSVMSDSL